MTSTLTASALDLTGEHPRKLLSYVAGEWVEGSGRFTTLTHAVTGAPVAEASSEGIDFAEMVAYARRVGGPALRKLTFHERALMLKAMAQFLTQAQLPLTARARSGGVIVFAFPGHD